MLTAVNWPANYASGLRVLPSNTVLISVNDEYCPLVPLNLDRLSSNILTVSFTDITAPLEHKGKIFNPLSQEDALKILDFINLHKDKNF